MRLKVDRFEAFLIISSFIWGTSFVATKVGVGEVDPFFFAFLRFLIATPVLLLVAYLFSDFDTRIFRDPIIWLVGALNAIGLCFQNAGMTTTSATNAVLLVDINVIFVAMLATVLLKERVTKFTIIGLLIGLLGVFVVSTGGDIGHMADGSMTGNLLVFSAGVIWAFYIVYQKMALTKHPDIFMQTGSVIVTTLLTCLPLTLLFTKSYALSTDGLIAALYVGLACTGGAFLLYIAGLRGKGATDSSIILLLEIVFAMFFAFLILGEVPDFITAIGGALIIAAILIVSIQDANGKRKAKG